MISVSSFQSPHLFLLAWGNPVFHVLSIAYVLCVVITLVNRQGLLYMSVTLTFRRSLAHTMSRLDTNIAITTYMRTCKSFSNHFSTQITLSTDRTSLPSHSITVSYLVTFCISVCVCYVPMTCCWSIPPPGERIVIIIWRPEGFQSSQGQWHDFLKGLLLL